MTLQLEYMQLKCQSFGEFLSKVNSRLSELGDSAKKVQLISNDYRTDTFVIITVESYTTKTQESES